MQRMLVGLLTEMNRHGCLGEDDSEMKDNKYQQPTLYLNLEVIESDGGKCDVCEPGEFLNAVGIVLGAECLSEEANGLRNDGAL
jgi:hypothetical protein